MSQTATTMGERVPNDVVEDILGQLPVKSLTRFRCVSRSCDSIITDPTFISKHFKLNLNQSESLVSTNTHTGYLLYTTEDKNSSPSSKHLCTVVCNSDSTLTQISRFEIPSLFEKYSIVGFCNGLFCLASSDNDLNHIIYLWNPSIRMFKKLLATPFTDKDNKKHKSSVVGLAYNSENNDFKILRLLSVLLGPEAKAEVEIYSLSTDSWRKVVISLESLSGYEPNFGGIFDIDLPCIFLNGALHTVAWTCRRPIILSFDVNDECFREIMLTPNHLRASVVTHFAQHALFKRSLALFTFTHSHAGVLCHIWVMEEYGVAESWTRKYSVPMIWVSVGNFYGCTDNGELLIKNATGLVSIDPESRKQNILAIEDADWVGFMANSMESLILLDGVPQSRARQMV
ncbi:F-box/kelch-repeat protein At3g23880-like isoform X1 [Quercus robur]|uniref:F-box/kelch-repeat protein At3g23880-like isoform X1 n=1 Tax=Quercus robur TaxID=38942 RepID=UPI0021619235|nr:F-box/kelch-repeat protein At3g23880-like isoform X1 [Quercus robur]